MVDPDAVQEAVDRFYWSSATPCCAGCDWWRHFNSLVGECLRTAPVAEGERWAMLGISSSSVPTGAGHIATARNHSCGEFKDGFDWASLPLPYQHRVGVTGSHDHAP
jgi:hypothetical protein